MRTKLWKKILLALVIVIALLGVLFYIHRLRQMSPPLPPGASAYTSGTYRASIVTKDGRTRSYLIHIPQDFSAEKQYPLVMLFHGGHGDARKILEQTNFEAKADEAEFIVVAPDGVSNTWNNGLTHDKTPEVSSIDDVAFVRELLADLESRFPMDATRIYATGPSNGGMFTERLGCDMSTTFAALAAVVGPMVETVNKTCHPTPVPLLGIQGGADPIVPLQGGELGGIGEQYGERGVVLSADANMRFWAVANGCNVTPTITHQTPQGGGSAILDTYTYSGCTKDLIYYIVQGMGHGWPPNQGRSGGPIPQNVSATDIIWDFFAQHHKQ